MAGNSDEKNQSRVIGVSDVQRQQAPVMGVRVGWITMLSWCALGLESILRPQQENIRDLIWMLPFTLTAVTFSCVHRVQRSANRLENFGYGFLMFAMVLVLLGNIGLLTNQPLLATMSFPWGDCCGRLLSSPDAFITGHASAIDNVTNDPRTLLLR